MWARDLAAGASQFRGTAAAGVAGLGGGMYLSGIPEDFAAETVVMYQNNMFGPAIEALLMYRMHLLGLFEQHPPSRS